MIIPIANQKGGVGKTTTAINLAAALGELGRTVLVIDLDPQANLTAGLDADPQLPTIYDVLTADCTLDDAIQETMCDGLWMVPSVIDLAAIELSLAQERDPECLLRAVSPVEQEFDFILTDCPPYLGQLTGAALTAGAGVLVPMLPSVWAVSGIRQLMDAIDLVGTRLFGILLTQYDRRTAVSDDVWNDLVKAELPLFRTKIPKRVAAEYAAIARVPILKYESSGTLARAYRRLAKEVDTLV